MKDHFLVNLPEVRFLGVVPARDRADSKIERSPPSLIESAATADNRQAMAPVFSKEGITIHGKEKQEVNPMSLHDAPNWRDSAEASPDSR